MASFIKQGSQLMSNVAAAAKQMASASMPNSTTSLPQQQPHQEHGSTSTPTLTKVVSPRTPTSNPLVPVRSSSSAAIDNRPWTVQDIGQNSIGSVLNDPTVASITQKIDSVSRQALSAIPKANIRNVKQREFEEYLREIKSVHATYQEVKMAVLEDPVLFDTEAIQTMRDQAKSGKIDVSRVKPQLKKKQTSEPIESVPAVFFEQDFNLENPRVFELVTEYANVATAAPSIGEKSGQATNALLQEKLSHYLDTVEVHLVSEISVRSLEFFAALANIQSLHQETIECLTEIRTIRNALSNVSDGQAKKGLAVVRKKKQRNNLQVLYNSVKMIKDIKKTQPMIQVMLNQGDFVGALDLISEANHSLRGTEGKDAKTAINLHGVRGLVHLSGQLSELSKVIEKLMEDNFIKTITDNLEALMDKSLETNEPNMLWAKKVLEAQAADGAQPSTSLISEADIAKEEMMRVILAPLILGLVRTERLGAVLQAYKDRLTKHFVKKITKRYFPPALPSDKNDSGEGSDGALAKFFKSLTFDDFMNLLKNTFITLLQLFKRVAIINEIIIQQLRESEKHGIVVGVDKTTRDEPVQPMSPASPTSAKASTLDLRVVTSSNTITNNYQQLINDVNNVLNEASDLAHVRCGKMLSLREEQNRQLNFNDFFNLYDLISNFINVGEAVCKNRVGRAALMTLAKGFINNFHMERVRQLTMIVENDQWAPADVPNDYQIIVNKITGTVNTATRSAAAEKALADLVSHPQDADDEDARARQANVQTGLVVDKRNFRVAACTLQFVLMIEQYLLCAKRVPAITPDVINRLIELLKVYNTRVCEALVGGHALQNGTLRSITAKHLALSAQSLGLMIALIPSIKSSLEQCLPQRQHILLNDFEPIIQDITRNQDQVFNRIVFIMEELLKEICKKIPEVQWDAPEPAAANAAPGTMITIEPQLYMAEIIKNTRKLHNTLKKYIFPDRLKTLFEDIFGIYNKYLENQYSALSIYSSIGKNRLLVDVQAYIANLSSLEHVNGPGNMLEVTINNIRIRDKREMRQQAPAPAQKSSSVLGNLPNLPSMPTLPGLRKQQPPS